jgi:hypothetical protein
MGARVKPVQPTEIKDIKIIREAIAQIRKPIPPEVKKRNAEIDAAIMKMVRLPGNQENRKDEYSYNHKLGK